MSSATVQSLLGAVRRRLWLGHFAMAARLSLWGSTALLLLAVAVHLVAGPVRIPGLLLAIALFWVATALWAATQRPSLPVCALWADRHLGGASAYSTLLELKVGDVQRHDQAVRWVERWAAESVPKGQRLLAERRAPARLVRPLFAAAVSTALAAIVLALPDLTPSARDELAGSRTQHPAEQATRDTVPLESADLAGELVSALRTDDSTVASNDGSKGQRPTAGSGMNDDTAGTPGVGRDVAPAGRDLAAGAAAPSGDPADATLANTRTQATGGGFGREAGDSQDDRANASVSRVMQGTLPVQRRELRTAPPAASRQADMDQLAAFDDYPATSPAATDRLEIAAAAATPPPATQATRLTPTAAAYVQAWLQTNQERR